jgi:hypothetical protein
VPFIPLIVVAIILILRPYYLFPVGPDADFHLARAREILQNPLYGIFWDYITYYPMGRPIWHQPLFHVVYAFWWFLGGVRFAHSVMCITQILLTVGVASWIANKEYGVVAGFFAGILALICPLSYTLIIALPATYTPIFAVLAIYYIPRDKKKAFIASLLGLWTHMVALASFIPLFLVDDYKSRTNQIIIALLLPSWLLWMGYWIYFKDYLVTGGVWYTLQHLKIFYIDFYGICSFFVLYVLGIIGLFLVYKSNRKQFNLIITYIVSVILVSFFGFNGDFLRGFQFAALPLAIVAGLTLQKAYEFTLKNYGKIYSYFLILVFITVLLFGTMGFMLNITAHGWEGLNSPFEGRYSPLKDYIETNTKESDIIWAQYDLTEKIAWMTGRKISNGRYPDGEYGGTRGFLDKKKDLNIYMKGETIFIKDSNNNTIKEFELMRLT